MRVASPPPDRTWPPLRRTVRGIVGLYVIKGSPAVTYVLCYEAAEEFIKDDFFVLNGVVRRWQIRQWNDILASPCR